MILVLISAIAGGAITYAITDTDFAPPFGGASAQGAAKIRSYSLDMVATDIEVGEGTVWHAWTFNGSVPGPMLEVMVGETLRVTVHNKHTLTHSFHTHVSPYPLEMDGSQINTITGVGAGAMIPPGGEYTYEYRPTLPGLYYYHCHSADGDMMISQHIAQGLYGAIIVKSPDEPQVRDEVVFMAEIGSKVDGDNRPFFIMNGKGIPGGEHTLEKIFAEKGIDGVVAQFGKTVPAFNGKIGETVRFNVVNIGDQIHSFHLHGMNMVRDDDPQKIVTANVLQLVPGGAGRFLVTPTEPGVWLFHCHVVSHADMGMIGVFVVG
ncbi:MAG: multicopper oxidase domain-containing protein [Euryarchaeota archaeon]|nr:multicopper oxidase domain-containing protein [Euryarchaeota archaeon]